MTVGGKDRSKDDLLSGVPHVLESKKIGHCRVWYKKELAPNVVLEYFRYHDTDIARYNPYEQIIKLSSGGWRTATTKENINRALAQCGFPGIIYQEKGKWIYIDRLVNDHASSTYRCVFFDGMKLGKDGIVKNRPTIDESKRVDETVKLIRKYTKAMWHMHRMTGHLPNPAPGDCWECSMRNEEGKTLGDLSGSNHLQSHLEEIYVHGHLIYNAIEDAGYNPQYVYNNITTACRCVTRYFKRALSIAR